MVGYPFLSAKWWVGFALLCFVKFTIFETASRKNPEKFRFLQG